MKQTILLSAMLIYAFTSSAQSDTIRNPGADTIIFKGNLWTGEKYSYKGNSNIRFKDIKSVLKIDKENERLISNAETAKVFSTLFGFAGGFCIGYAIGGAITGKDINMPLLGVGAGLIVVAIPISSGYVKSVKKAVRNFNRRQ